MINTAYICDVYGYKQNSGKGEQNTWLKFFL